MRSFFSFFGLILAGFAAMALLAYPAWLLLHPSFDFPFHRIASRIGMLALLVGFILVARRLNLADRASLGYGLERRRFIPMLLRALALGVATMLPIVGVMYLLDMRAPRDGIVVTGGVLTKLALIGLVRGVVVSFFEETFLRGAMFTGIARESGVRTAVVLTALVYASLHFIGRFHIPADQVSWQSGVVLLGGTLREFADPLGIADAFLCLFAVGLLLGMVRALTGSIAACIGLHAGWVWVITFVRETSVRDPSSPLAFLLSRFDGVVGWLILAWCVVIGAALYTYYRRRARIREAGAPGSEGLSP